MRVFFSKRLSALAADDEEAEVDAKKKKKPPSSSKKKVPAPPPKKPAYKDDPDAQRDRKYIGLVEKALRKKLHIDQLANVKMQRTKEGVILQDSGGSRQLLSTEMIKQDMAKDGVFVDDVVNWMLARGAKVNG